MNDINPYDPPQLDEEGLGRKRFSLLDYLTTLSLIFLLFPIGLLTIIIIATAESWLRPEADLPEDGLVMKYPLVCSAITGVLIGVNITYVIYFEMLRKACELFRTIAELPALLF